MHSQHIHNIYKGCSTLSNIASVILVITIFTVSITLLVLMPNILRGGVLEESSKSSVDEENRLLMLIPSLISSAKIIPPTKLVTTEYAKVVSYELSDLGIPKDTSMKGFPLLIGHVEQPTSFSDGLILAEIQNNVLRIATPTDSGIDQDYLLILTTPSGKEFDLTVRAVSLLTNTFSKYSEQEENTEQAIIESYALTASGISTGNIIGDMPLVFSMAKAPKFNKTVSDSFLQDKDGYTYSLSQFWIYSSESNDFTIPQAQLQNLLDSIPKGEYTLVINLVSDDFNFAEVFELKVINPQAIITGQIIDDVGMPLTNLQNTYIALTGSKSGIRQVSTVDLDGSFIFQNLIPDTYNISVIDLLQPYYYSIDVPIFSSTTFSNATIFYQPIISLQDQTPIKDSTKNFNVVGFSIQDGYSPEKRSAKEIEENTTFVHTITKETSDTVFSVSSGSENVTQSKHIDYTAPADVKNVGVKIVITSNEYPTYTQNPGNLFDDRWGYSLSILNSNGPSIITDSGNVNSSHHITGTIEKTYCFEQSSNDSSSPISITGNIRSINIGDSAVATTVEVTIQEDFGELQVSEAVIGGVNRKGYLVVGPKNRNNNIDGRYLSFSPISQKAWGIPLTVKYVPKAAKIEELTLSAVKNGQILAESSNILSQARLKKEGIIQYSDLYLPPLNVTVTGDIGLSVKLKGQLNGITTASTGELVNVQFGSHNTFTPLFRVSEKINTNERRYGQGIQDLGKDDWGTTKMITWLSSHNYRFNDISALHIAQTTNGRSVLNHSGHSDGMQADLRYVDAEGEFSDFGPADFVLHFLRDTAINDPQRLANWVNINRLHIESVAGQARKIYIGNGIIGKALVDGKTFNDTAITGDEGQVGDWISRPSNVVIASNHNHHWHISLK